MVNIANIVPYTEPNLKNFNYAQKRQICPENSKYMPDENFVANFAFAERLPTSATLLLIQSSGTTQFKKRGKCRLLIFHTVQWGVKRYILGLFVLPTRLSGGLHLLLLLLLLGAWRQ